MFIYTTILTFVVIRLLGIENFDDIVIIIYADNIFLDICQQNQTNSIKEQVCVFA